MIGLSGPESGRILVNPTKEQIERDELVKIDVGETLLVKGCECRVVYIKPAAGTFTLKMIPKRKGVVR